LRDLHRLTLQMIFFFAGGKLINSKTSTQTNVSINHGLRVVSQMGPKAMIESIIDMFNARPHESFYGSLWFSNPPKKKNTRKPKRKEWKGSLRQVASTPTSLLFYFFFFFFWNNTFFVTEKDSKGVTLDQKVNTNTKHRRQTIKLEVETTLPEGEERCPKYVVVTRDKETLPTKSGKNLTWNSCQTVDCDQGRSQKFLWAGASGKKKLLGGANRLNF
jgi:hypothetical protein